ncbi:MAG: ATP-binding protein [Pseudonocardiaceae bacterium]
MGYVPRLVDPLLRRLLDGLPAVLVVGPRASGKTTSSRRLTVEELRLDRPADAALARADPDLALRLRREPLLLDEWQLVPEVLGAVKRAVDDEPRPTRFVITGSAQADLTAAGWPATGRAVRIPMWGLCQRELVGDPEAASVIDRIAEGGPRLLQGPADPPDLAGYVDSALRGGFPEAALQTNDELRNRWLASYVDEIVARDGALVDGGRDPVRLRRYLQACAASTAGVVQHKTLYDAAEINRMTATSYDRLLTTLLVIESVPAWSTNRLSRLTTTPKRHLVEPALLGPLLGARRTAVLQDGDLLGRLLDSFVIAQLRSELVVSELGPRLYHLRQENGRHEVDLIIELADGRVIGIEIKAAAAPRRADGKHLSWLRDHLGDRFLTGLVLHTGPHSYPLDERLYAVPISALWGP